MKKPVLCSIAAACTLILLLITNDKVKISKEDLAEAQNSVIAQKIQADLGDIKKLMTLPEEKRRSYLLDDKRIKTYKSLLD